MFPQMGEYYIREAEENWDVSEDVAGFEYPAKGCHYRIGITREVLQTQFDIVPLFDILNAPFDRSITRNIARAVIAKSLLQHPPDALLSLLSTDLESVISLEDSENRELADCYQIIFGRNHSSRQKPVDVVLSELETAERIFAKAKMKPYSLAFMDRLKTMYSFERITAESDPKLLDEYRILLRTTFGYGLEDLDVLLDEDAIIIMAITEQMGQRNLAGGAFAFRDRTYLKRYGHDVILNTYEMTGALVREEHQGKGLLKGITLTLLKSLARCVDSVDVVFSFANIEAPAVLKVAAQTHQILVTETAQHLHLSIKPSIQQNLVNGKYVDDIVTYIPGEYLRRQY